MWAGRVSAHHVLRLVQHLSIMPQSRVAAIDRGDLEWMGWDVNTSALQGIHNLLALIVGGLSKDVNTADLMFNAPGHEEAIASATEITFPTIADFIANEAVVKQFMK